MTACAPHLRFECRSDVGSLPVRSWRNARGVKPLIAAIAA
jgi:hypothetical protein